MYKKSNLYPKIAVGVLAFLMITISMFSFANNVQAIKGEIPVTSPEKEKGPKNPVTPPGKNK